MGQAKGLFGGSSGSIPLSPELYAFSDIASILLLFIAGLETDIDLFIKYALKGSIVGLGGLIFFFFAAQTATVLLFNVSYWDPLALFMGLTAPTSVGISTKILSDKKYILNIFN